MSDKSSGTFSLSGPAPEAFFGDIKEGDIVFISGEDRSGHYRMVNGALERFYGNRAQRRKLTKGKKP